MIVVIGATGSAGGDLSRPTTDAVKQVLGRPALDFATWAAENARAFRR